MAASMAQTTLLLLGLSQMAMMACDKGSLASGMPINSSACPAATACSMAMGLARPTSSLAWAMIRRASMRGSAPAYSSRLNQKSAASLSEPRRLLQKADSIS